MCTEYVFGVGPCIAPIFSGDDTNIDTGVTASNNGNSNVTADESEFIIVWSSQRAESYKKALDETLQRVAEG